MSKSGSTGMLQSIAKYRIGNLSLVPPIIAMLCRRPEARTFDLSNLRTISSSTAPLFSERLKQLTALLPQLTIFQRHSLIEVGIFGMETNNEQRDKTGVSVEAPPSCPSYN